MPLTQQQIDETNALLQRGNTLGQQASQQSGLAFTPTPAYNPQAPITGDDLAPAPAINLTPPAQPEAPGLNSSVTTPEAIIDSAYEQTDTESQQNALLKEIANMTGSQSGLTTLTNEAENAGGVAALNSSYNEIAAQLEGLNNQATALQNEFNYTIPNQAQVNAEGRGITAAGLAPVTASQLRMNQIKQGAIATQALTLKSLAYAALGKLNLAKDAAEKAAKAKFEQQEIDLNKKLADLAALQPTLTREQNKRAEITKARLEAEKVKMENERKDYESAQALAAAAIRNNPNNQAALFAANEALKIKSSDPDYLQKVFSLVGKYQTDPVAVKTALLQQKKLEQDIALAPLDSALKNAQLKQINAQTLKILNDIKPVAVGADGKPILSQEDQQKVNKELVGSDAYKAIRKSQDSLQALDAFSKLFSTTGGTSAVFSPRQNAELKAKYNATILNLKEFFNLGVLNGPDEAILRGVIPDPTNRSAGLTAVSFGIYKPSANTKAGIDNMKRQIEQTIDDRYQSVKGQFDYSPDSVSSLRDLNRIYVEQKMKLNPEVAKMKKDNPNLTDEDIILILGK